MSPHELINTETGEVVEPMTASEASNITEEISAALDGIADSYERVMPLIREALTRQAFAALGYRAPGEYIAEEFGGALERLGADARRGVVHELSAAGMSTRAIAPVVGASQKTVARDLHAPTESGDSVQDHDASNVVGINGKTYQRPKPKPMPPPVPTEDTPEARRRDARALLRRIVDLVALNGEPPPGWVDAWADRLGDVDDELDDLIQRTEQTGTALLALADRKRS